MHKCQGLMQKLQIRNPNFEIRNYLFSKLVSVYGTDFDLQVRISFWEGRQELPMKEFREGGTFEGVKIP
jgi:hypothetical protein